MKTIIKKIVPACVALAVSGCSLPIINDRPSLQRTQVQPVMTEHSLALACLGDLIDRSGKPPLSVYVRDIGDKTVPVRYEKRRLSLGGRYWLHNAINRLGTERVVSVVRNKRALRAARHIELAGAWTQDDLQVGRTAGEIDGEYDGSDTSIDYFFGASRSYDVIAGDFLTVQNGRVTQASAISLAVGSGRDGFGLRIQDGRHDVAVDFSTTSNEGPQFAQRRIAEAAALVHIGNAFGIDYQPCIEMGWASPVRYQEQIAAYLQMKTGERHRAVQQALTAAGYDVGSPDGVWGHRSANALRRFQLANDMPASGRHSAEVYAALKLSADG